MVGGHAQGVWSAFKAGYVTAKHALEGFSKVVAVEGGPHGVTSNCINPGYVRTALVQKQVADQARCLAALLALGRDGDAASSRDLGFVGLLLGGGAAQSQVPAFIESVLSPLLDYDRRRSTDLVRTLEVYFSCGGQMVKAKDILHVHVNTVAQRLDRIAHLLGAGWSSPERALELQLALRLHRLR
jgi:DNA-binding PucR family transcriptional regulator